MKEQRKIVQEELDKFISHNKQQYSKLIKEVLAGDQQKDINNLMNERNAELDKFHKMVSQNISKQCIISNVQGQSSQMISTLQAHQGLNSMQIKKQFKHKLFNQFEMNEKEIPKGLYSKQINVSQQLFPSLFQNIKMDDKFKQNLKYLLIQNHFLIVAYLAQLNQNKNKQPQYIARHYFDIKNQNVQQYCVQNKKLKSFTLMLQKGVDIKQKLMLDHIWQSGKVNLIRWLICLVNGFKQLLDYSIYNVDIRYDNTIESQELINNKSPLFKIIDFNLAFVAGEVKTGTDQFKTYLIAKTKQLIQFIFQANNSQTCELLLNCIFGCTTTQRQIDNQQIMRILKLKQLMKSIKQFQNNQKEESFQNYVKNNNLNQLFKQLHLQFKMSYISKKNIHQVLSQINHFWRVELQDLYYVLQEDMHDYYRNKLTKILQDWEEKYKETVSKQQVHQDQNKTISQIVPKKYFHLRKVQQKMSDKLISGGAIQSLIKIWSQLFQKYKFNKSDTTQYDNFIKQAEKIISKQQ